MTQPESLTPGGQANLDFIDNLKRDFPEADAKIPDGCKGCSAAWHHASRDWNLDLLKDCPGQIEVEIGERIVTMCRFGMHEEEEATASDELS